MWHLSMDTTNPRASHSWGYSCLQVNYQRGQNLTLILAISPDIGVIHFKFVLGSVTGPVPIP